VEPGGMTLGFGPAMVLAGLLLGILGVFLALVPLARLTRKDVEERAKRSGASDVSNGALSDPLLVQMLRERSAVRWGLAVLLLGFCLQLTGTVVGIGAGPMNPRSAEECNSMDEVRAEIDRIDRQLVDLIGERFTYVDRAWQLKQAPSEARVPWRIQQVIDKVRARAVQNNLPPELIEALWRQMIGWFIQYEEEKLRENGDGG
jgi:isochorismate pyruvate lyase